jgi:hypothetical protein
MKHYVIVLQESRVSNDVYIDKHYIKDSYTDGCPPYPLAEKSGLDCQSHINSLVEYGFRPAMEWLALDFGDNQKRTPRFFPATLIEFVLGNYGILTIVFFSFAGNYIKSQVYRLEGSHGSNEY